MFKRILFMISILFLLLCDTVFAYVSDNFETVEEAEEWAKEIGIEYYDDANYFNCYDENFDVFYNESNDVYLDFIEGESITEGLGEVLLNRGYTYSDGIWSDEYGFYYEDSWEYMSWDEAEELYDESGANHCEECENIIEDRYSDHDESCPNNPQREVEREEKETRKEDTRTEQNETVVIVVVVIGVLAILSYLEKRKQRKN